jgi:uncharacterized phage protein (TIGR02220 family)
VARIRTIKPDFFTSADIVSLTFAARLLYVALWCEADREGRLVWHPATFKLRYFPGDKVNINAICQELILKDLVVLYGENYGYIPTFRNHQHLNPRESPSKLPVPDASSRVTDASNLDMHAQVGREGKGREGKDKDTVGQKPDLKPLSVEVLNFLNSKTGRRYEPVPANLSLIAARLREGASVDDLRAVVAKKCRDWGGDPKMNEYLRPKTLFNATNYAQYRGELVAVEAE